jgi:hypothetical protein
VTPSADDARLAWTTPSVSVLSVTFDTAFYNSSSGDGQDGSSYKFPG